MVSSTGCKKDDPAPARKSSYSLVAKDVLGITGTATFTETSSTTTTIDLVLNGAPSGDHPAELCMNSAVEGGPVVVALNPVDASGKSSTSVPTMSYTQLISYDGFIKVHKSATEPGIITRTR